MLVRAGFQSFVTTFSRVNIHLKFALVFSAIVLTLAVCYTIGTFMTFQPYRIIGYTVEPTSSCPLEYVNVQIKRDATRPFGGKISATYGTSYWLRPANDGGLDQIVGAEPIVKQPFNGVYGVMSRSSPIKRSAPSEPGQYHLVTVLNIEGNIFNKSREAEGITYIDPNTFTVRDCVGP
jgi:hypothetical protein